MDIAELDALAGSLRGEIAKVILGQEELVDHLLLALLCEGHVLLEGVPGTAKTLLARSVAAALDLRFNRVQFTPDLLPGDVLGSNIFDFASNRFELTRGPVFTDLLLADEINRTPPKTQSALLQAMQERDVTLDGTTHPLGEFFLVIATQNPVEHQGTYPLPEAQLDRFLFKLDVGYPTEEQERDMVLRHGQRATQPDPAALGVRPVAGPAQLQAARACLAGLQLEEPVAHYIVSIVRATRDHGELLLGASPRAANLLAVASRARAALDGRDYVLPDDVKAVAFPTLRHRLLLDAAAELHGQSADRVLEGILEEVPAPR